MVTRTLASLARGCETALLVRYRARLRVNPKPVALRQIGVPECLSPCMNERHLHGCGHWHHAGYER